MSRVVICLFSFIKFYVYLKYKNFTKWKKNCRIYEKKIGNKIPQFPQFGKNVIEIPQQLINENIINEVYGNISKNILANNIL